MDPASYLSEKGLDFALKLLIQELGYLLCFKIKVNKLNQKAGDLQNKELAVQQQIEEAERNGRERLPNVRRWLLKVDKIKKDIQEVGISTKTKWSNYDGFLPYLFVRHQRGRRVAKLAEDVNELLRESQFDKIFHRPPPTWVGSDVPETGSEGLDSRIEIVKEIMKALRDSSVRTIGICGQGGVGKTTLVKEVANKARKEMLFAEVVIATVKRNPQIRSIQGQIADILGMTLEEETEMGRAGQLRERLKKYENILLIIDDLWDGLDLNMLGVPVHDDESVSLGTEKDKEVYGGCKIILTSRSREVLSTQMAVKENSIFSLAVLEEKEAVLLFKKVAGLHDENSEFESLASEVSTKCAGLPVALVTVGKALKNKSSFARNKVLRQLEKQEFIGVQEYMEFSTKLSYDHLKNEELKATFLLCAQMGNDSLIVDLLRYCIGLGMFEGVNSISETRDKLNELIGLLRSSSLLLDSYSSERFAMHDLVRDAALSMAFKERHAFIKRNVKLDYWLDEEKLQEYTTISLHYCDIFDELPQNINCPRLKVFHVENKDHTLRIPDKFFEGMTKLLVLVLKGFDLSCMPSSIKCLKNLRMLCLEQCVIGDGISLIGELKNLRILSLSGSQLKCFPSELGHNLKLLDISNCFEFGVIPPNVISCLNNLEEFYLRNIFVKWEIEGKATTSLADLSHLTHLKALDIHIPNLDVFPKNLYFHALDYYMITIGDFNMFLLEGFKMPDLYEISRTLALHLKEGNNIHSQKDIKLLFKTVENLFLGKLNGVENIFYELNLQGFPNLKHLYIANNYDIKYIFNSMNLFLLQDVFPKLESLHLYKLEKLKTICSSTLSGASFRNLKLVKIKMCHQLQNLFSLSMVRLLTKLEKIEVSDCNALKEIVDIQRQGNTEIVGDHEVDKVVFPELRHVTLQCLFQLTGFYTNGMLLFSETVEIPELENLVLSSIKISQIWGDIQTSATSKFKHLIKLEVKKCDNLKYLLSISMAGFLEKLKNLHVSSCEGMEELIAQEDTTNITEEVHIFPNLKEIKLSDMRNLTEIWHKVGKDVGSKSYCKLESVVIEKCEKLVTVFPSHVAGMLKSIDSLVVRSSDSVETLFDISNIIDLPTDGEKDICLRKVYVRSLRNLKHVWNKDPEGILNFQKLQYLMVFLCPKIKNLFPFSVARGLDQFEYLHIWGCDGMEHIVGSGQGSNVDNVAFEFPQLTWALFHTVRELRSIYPGKHEIKWPQLKNFEWCHCDKLTRFTAETTNPERLPILSEQVILNLQWLKLSSKEADLLSCSINNCHLNNLKALELNDMKNPEFLFRLLPRTPNLEKLFLWNCGFQKLLPSGRLAALEKIGTVVQLKDLKLSAMGFLHDIGFEQDPTLFQQLQRLTIKQCRSLTKLALGSICFNHLTYLKVLGCDGLINVMESSTANSLSQLTILKVSNCKMMEEIVAEKGNGDERESEIAFHRLTTLKLDSLKNLSSFCSSKYCLFIFPLLESLVVSKCPKMKIFSQGVIKAPKLRKVYFTEEKEEGKSYWSNDLNNTLRKVSMDMTSLEYIDVLNLCDFPQLEEFWQGNVPLPENWFTNLKSLEVENCEFVSTVIPCHVLPYLKNLEDLQVESCISVEKIFDISDIKTRGDVHTSPTSNFQSLINLDVKNCDHLKYLLSISMAAFLVNLKSLHVSNCEGMEELIAQEDSTNITKEVHIFRNLKAIELKELTNLTEIWHKVGNDVGSDSYCNLESVVIEKCEKLVTVFPPYMAGMLKSIDSLEVRWLDSVETLFDIANIIDLSIDGEKDICLRKVHIWSLPNLKHIWNRDPEGILNFPNLQDVHVCLCNNITKLFPFSVARGLNQLESIHIITCKRMEHIVGSGQGSNVDNVAFEFPQLTSVAFGELPELRSIYPGKHEIKWPQLKIFEWFRCDKLTAFMAEATNPERLPEQVFLNLQWLKLSSKEADLLSCSINNCHLDNLKSIELNDMKNPEFLFRLLPKTPNLEKVFLWNCDFQKLLPSGRLAALEKIGTVVQLKDLTLSAMHFLHDVGFEQGPILFQQLQRLTIKQCRGLTKLAPGSICFNHLTYLKVRGCDGLINLMESSTAKSLTQLTTLKVSNCKVMEEIVVEKGSSDERENEIAFGRLTTLKLDSLENLSSFCSYKYCLFIFPLLECLVVSKCPKMKIFSQGVIKAPELRKVYFAKGKKEGKSYWSGDLNDTLRKVPTNMTGL